MRVSRDQARENRKRVVDVSSRLFRAKGVEGVAIADVMNEAGLTHGGFYKQFPSKADLVAEACAAALDQTLSFWREHLSGAENQASAFIGDYLSERHRDSVAEGCLLPALAGEALRQSPAAREVFTRAIEVYVDLLDAPPERRTPQSRIKALAALSEIVGSILLARATTDTALSAELLAAARSTLLERAGETAPASDGAGPKSP